MGKKCSKIRGRNIPIFQFYLDQIHLISVFQESPQKRMNATDSDSDFNSPQRKKIKREVFKTTEDNSPKIKKVGMRYRNVLIFIFNSEASVLLYLSVIHWFLQITMSIFITNYIFFNLDIFEILLQF